LEDEGKKPLGQPDIKGWLKDIFTEEQVFILIRARTINMFIAQNEGELKNTRNFKILHQKLS
jgi:hypothetical protein